MLVANTAAANTAILQGLIDGGQLHIQLPFGGPFELNSISLASNVHLRGFGKFATEIFWASQNINDEPDSYGLLNVHGTSITPIENVILEAFTVNGNKAGITISGTTSAVDVECVSHTWANKCTSLRMNFINAVGDGVDYDDCTECVTIDCEAHDCDGFGCHNSLRSSFNSHARFNAYDCGAVHSRGGLDTHGTSPNEATDCTFVDCSAFSCYRGLLLGGHRNNAVGCKAIGSTNTGIRIGGTDNTLEGCYASGTTAGNGFTIDGAASGDRNALTACVSRDNTGSGILASSGALHNAIVGCQAHNNTGTGFVLSAGANSNTLIGCVAAGNTVAQVTNSGATNQVANNIT